MSATLLLTAKEAAALLGVSTRTLWRLSASGDLPCVHVGKATRWRRSDVEKYVSRLR